MGYYDIDEILAEEEKFQVVWRNDVKTIASLAPTSVDDDEIIKKGTKIDISWWLCEELFNRGFINVKIPRAFATQGPFKESLRADPRNISFNRHPYYYEIASKLSTLEKMGLQDLGKVIERAWGMRWSLLLNHCFSLQTNQISNPLYTHSFSQSEYELYKIAHKTASDYVNWKINGNNSGIVSVSNPIKRARPIL